MDTATLIVTTIGGALSATLGVVVGGLVTRHSQQRHWLRDRQLQAYDDLFAQYARFMILLNRSHLGRQHVDIDWAAWSAALTSASLVAPLAVARAIDGFGAAIGGFLSATGSYDPVDNPMDEETFTELTRPAAAAHLVLLNAIRQSMGRSLEPLTFYLGGTLGRHPEGSASRQ